MSKIITLSVMVSLLSGCASLDFTPRPWTKSEKVLGGVFLATHAMDWYTTKRHQSFESIHEVNPVMGSYPSNGRIDAYFSVSAVVGLGVAHVMPKYRKWILGVLSVNGAYWSYHNYKLIDEAKEKGWR